MSTPVSVEPPPRAHLRTDSEQERYLQERLQRMIKLQYEQQQLSERGSAENTEIEGKMPKRTTTELMGLNSLVGEENDDGIEEAVSRFTTPYNSTARNNGQGLPPPSPSSAASGVGRGTMYFSSTYQSGGKGVPSNVPINLIPPINPPINPPDQIYAGGYGSVADQGHDFHYGNPDYHDPYDAIHNRRAGSDKSFCEKCCCLYRPLMNILSQEHLHRSFCYGAIDGMLTGSGIVSAFRALNVLTISTRWEVRLAVVVFCAAACVADSLCMAIGHIWTSYVMSMGHARERANERKLLDSSRADAKAKLVDALLARGMLKIDAMSLADTLEGYPDLFIGALVGDSLLAAAEEADDETDDSHFGMSNTGFKFPSYGQFNDMEHDVDMGNVNTVVKESQKEGFFMLTGFAVFAVVPSLLWLFLPDWFHPPDDAGENEAQTISLPSLILTISALIMWFLGVWKSKFLDSNWAVFGIETVVVLLVCVFSSYGVGSLLFYSLGDSMEGLVLTNVPSTA